MRIRNIINLFALIRFFALRCLNDADLKQHVTQLYFTIVAAASVNGTI